VKTGTFLRARRSHPLRDPDQTALSTSRREFTKTILSSLGSGALLAVAGSFASRAASAPQRFNFQSIWLNDPEFIGYMIAIDNGYYAAEGLSINYMPGGPDVIPEAVLLSGKADISLTNLTGAVRAAEKGAQLKIIGAQYQKSPIGVISLEKSNIRHPKDLVGKTVACPPLSLPIFQAVLRISGVSKDQVRIVPFAFDPMPLVRGNVDAIVEFVTELPFLIEQKSGQKTYYFLFWDVGLPLFIDLVTVRSETLSSNRSGLVKFLRASRRGWIENNADPLKYPARYADSWFKGNGISLEAENYYNKTQISLMSNPKGLFSLEAASIDTSLAALGHVGLKGSKDMFDATLLEEL
jgi:ABC-type nitrate/sulfonate/bicarbonate transport system substrate-binding protein